MKVLDLSYHPSDVRSGGWLDLSREGNHGTPYGGARPYMIAPGVMGFEFDGDTGYTNHGSNECFNLTDEVTIALWYYPPREYSAVKAFHLLVAKTSGWAEGYSIIVDYDQQPNPVKLFGNNLNDFASYTIPKYSQWYYVVGTIKSSITEGKLYINSSLENTVSLTIGTNSEPVRIGGGVDGRYSHGIIAQPVIEDRAWSEAEVRENMYRSPIYRMLRGLPHSWIYMKVPWKQTQGGIYVP